MNKDQHGKHTVGYQPCSMTDLNRAVAVLNNGGVVAFPTETYYGLAVDPLNPLALNHLFALKQRDIAKPILTLVDNRESLISLVHEVPIVYSQLMEKFWPGPLTLIFQAKINLPTLLTAGTSTIGVRQSSHPFARPADRRPPARANRKEHRESFRGGWGGQCRRYGEKACDTDLYGSCPPAAGSN